MKNNQWSIRCSNILYIHSHYHAFALQGMEGALGPIGIIGPSGHPVRTSYLILSAKLYVTSACFLAMMEWSSVSYLSIRGPRVTKGVGGRWCVAPFWWILFCLYYEQRIRYFVWRQHSTRPPLPSALFISYCALLFVVTLTLTLSCCGIPVGVINVGCMLISSFLRGLLSALTRIIHSSNANMEIRFYV